MIDYEVSDKLRKVWSVELDIYKKFREICSKHKLKQYAVCGTVLGAVRHKGFIPWDDDMDFGMPYEDYVKFLEVAPKECEYPYYFQSYITDPVWGEMSHSRIRRSDTTACTKWEHDNIVRLGEADNYNLGIFIDIFPICHVPDDPDEVEKRKNQIMDVWKAIRGYTALYAQNKGNDRINLDYVKYIEDFKKYSDKYSIGELKALYTKLCGGEGYADSSMVGLTTYRTFYQRLMWNATIFNDTIELPFENTFIVSPKDYESMLVKTYGDWRTPVKDAAFHGTFIIDPDISYQDNKLLK